MTILDGETSHLPTRATLREEFGAFKGDLLVWKEHGHSKVNWTASMTADRTTHRLY